MAATQSALTAERINKTYNVVYMQLPNHGRRTTTLDFGGRIMLLSTSRVDFEITLLVVAAFGINRF